MRAVRVVAVAAGLILLLYGTACAGLYIAMRLPPEQFGAIMSHVPPVAMMILPFQPLWMSARAGHLSVGDPAPGFSLSTVDGSRTVTLSQEWRERPVVLVFGSYT